MKVYTKVVIDMTTMEVVEEESFEYEGEVALCKGGGGGGSSGKVDYPTYIKVVHADWLGGGSPDGSGMASLPAGYSLTEILYDTMTSNPYEGKDAYDPSSRISTMEDAVSTFKTGVDSQLDSVKTDLNDYLSSVASDIDSYLSDLSSRIDGLSVGEFSSDVEIPLTKSQIESEIASFDAGMQDINAVMSSAFVVGRQLVAGYLLENMNRTFQAQLGDARLRAELEWAKAKLSAQLEQIKGIADEARIGSGAKLDLARLKAGYETELARLRVSSYGEHSRLAAEVQRLAIIALQEQVEKDLEIDDNFASWRIDKFMDAANVLAAASGGTVSKTRGPSRVQSALAAGISGAGMGYLAANSGMMGSIGGPVGAAIGATIGIGMSLLG